MRKGSSEEGVEFQLDLTQEKKEHCLEGIGLGCDILQYSNDESINEEFLKEIKQEQRAQERKKQEEERMNTPQGRHSVLSANSSEERKRQRKAIFDKYRKKEVQQSINGADNIVDAFEEIFKKKGDKYQEGATHVQYPHSQPFAELVKPLVEVSGQGERGSTRIFPAKTVSNQEECSLVVSDGNDLDHHNLRESIQTTLTQNNQGSLAGSNVNADPVDTIIEPSVQLNGELQQQASIQISGIRGQANNDALNASQQPSKEMMLEIEDLLNQHIFQDASQFDNVNKSTGQAAPVPVSMQTNPVGSSIVNPSYNDMHLSNKPSESEQTASPVLNSNLAVPFYHKISGKQRATTVRKIQQVAQFLNDDALHPQLAPAKDIDEFLRDSPVKQQEVAPHAVLQVSQVFDYEPEANLQPTMIGQDHKNMPDDDDDEDVELELESHVLAATSPANAQQQNNLQIMKLPTPQTQELKPVESFDLANPPPTIARINELLMQRILQTINQPTPQQPNQLTVPVSKPMSPSPAYTPAPPTPKQHTTSPMIMPSQQVTLNQMVLPNLNYPIQPVKPLERVTPPITKPNDNLVQKERTEFSELVNNIASHDSILAEPEKDPMICELMREACRLNTFVFNLRPPNGHLLVLRCKDHLRRLIFELNSAGQVLWSFNQEIYARQVEQTKLYNSFRPEAYMLGAWMKPLSRPVALLRPGDLSKQQQRKLGDYSRARVCLVNAAEVLKTLSDKLDIFRIDPSSAESLGRYAEIRKALDDITGNLVRLSEDLFVKAGVRFLPEHFFTFYDYLASNGAYPQFSDLRVLIKEREDMLTQVLYLRDEMDPLCGSQVGSDLFNRLHADLRKLKADFFGMGRPMTPTSR